MGKAIVVSGTEGLRGVVTHGRTGLVVPPGDRAAMRAAIEFLLRSPAARSEMGGAAQLEARRRFDVDIYADTLARHLEETRGVAAGRFGRNVRKVGTGPYQPRASTPRTGCV